MSELPPCHLESEGAGGTQSRREVGLRREKEVLTAHHGGWPKTGKRKAVCRQRSQPWVLQAAS